MTNSTPRDNLDRKTLRSSSSRVPALGLSAAALSLLVALAPATADEVEAGALAPGSERLSTLFPVNLESGGLAFAEALPPQQEDAATTAPVADEKTADEIAKELSNPAGATASLTSRLDFVQFDGELPGADDETGFTYLFQPGLPYPLKSGGNLLIRPAIPIHFKQPLPSLTGVTPAPLFPRVGFDFVDSGVNLGNIGFDVAYGKTLPSGILYFAGMVGGIPSATDKDLEGEWTAGPEFALGKITKWGVYGALITQSWDIGGRNNVDVTGGQYFYAISMPKGWQIAAGPTFSFNHDTEDWTLPLATGLSKTAFLGGIPWKFAGQIWYFVEAPDAFGPKWQLSFSVAP